MIYGIMRVGIPLSPKASLLRFLLPVQKRDGVLKCLPQTPPVGIGEAIEGFNSLWRGLDIELCVPARAAAAGAL